MAPLWATAVGPVRPLFMLVPPPALVSAAASRVHWGFVIQNVTMTKRSPLPPSLALSIYLYLFFLHLSSAPPSNPTPPWPASGVHPSPSSYTTLAALSRGLALPLWLLTARGHSEGSSGGLNWIICVVMCNWNISSLKTCSSRDLFTSKVVGSFQNPEKIAWRVCIYFVINVLHKICAKLEKFPALKGTV